MNAFTGFLVIIALATGLATGTVFLLRQALGSLLVELCGNEARARFWAIYSSLVLVLSTLTGMLLFPPPDDSALWVSWPALYDLLPMFRAGMIGLLTALTGLALVLLIGIGFYNERKTGKA